MGERCFPTQAVLQCSYISTPQVDAKIVVGLAQALEPLKGQEEEPLDEALLRTIALSSAGDLSPMAAILGAVAAQEVLKVGTVTGREEEGDGEVCGSVKHQLPDHGSSGFTNLGTAFSCNLRGLEVGRNPQCKVLSPRQSPGSSCPWTSGYILMPLIAFQKIVFPILRTVLR